MPRARRIDRGRESGPFRRFRVMRITSPARRSRCAPPPPCEKSSARSALDRAAARASLLRLRTNSHYASSGSPYSLTCGEHRFSSSFRRRRFVMTSASTTIRQFLLEAQTPPREQRRCVHVAIARRILLSLPRPTPTPTASATPAGDQRTLSSCRCATAASRWFATRFATNPAVPWSAVSWSPRCTRKATSWPASCWFFAKSTMRNTGLATPHDRALCSHQLSKLLSLPADPVTGLLTRPGVEKLVEWRLGALGDRAASSVLYGDIDQLHVVNDLLGFEAGDHAIAAVATALSAQLATQDAVLSRLSGDRFTVFLPDCPLAKARKIAGDLRDAVQAATLTVAKTRSRFPSASARRRCAAANAASITRSRPPKSPARPRRIAAAIASRRIKCPTRASSAAATTSPSSADCARRSMKAASRSSGNRSRRCCSRRTPVATKCC